MSHSAFAAYCHVAELKFKSTQHLRQYFDAYSTAGFMSLEQFSSFFTQQQIYQYVSMPHNCEYTLLKEIQHTELKHLIYQSHYIVEQLQVVAKKTV